MTDPKDAGLAGAWEVLRPIAIGLSFVGAIVLEVVVARALWDSWAPILIVLLCLLIFLPLLLGIYFVLSFPANLLISIGSTRFPEDE